MPSRINFSVILIALFVVAVTASAGLINTGLVISQANQDADLELQNVPRNMTEPSDSITIEWEQDVPGTFLFATRFLGYNLDAYQAVDEPIDEGDGFVTVLGEQLDVGYLFCIIDGGDEGHSVVFNVIRVAGNAPEMVYPRTGGGRAGIPTVTPTFQWDPVGGVPFYHLIVSDQEFEIEEVDGQTRVQGANIIWQAITASNEIMYGIPDPSEYFDNDDTPPLVGNDEDHRNDRPRYAWVVLNNYGNHPAYTSTITGGVFGFEVEVDPPFEEAQNISPRSAAVLFDEEILFRWSQVHDAISYFLYVSREEITPGGSRALIPAWSAQTTFTTISCPAAEILPSGRYVWKVLAASQQGFGTLSDTTSFSYSIESGEITFTTQDTSDNILEFVEITADPIEGAAMPTFSTNDQGVQTRTVPVGRYVFYGNKEGYREAETEIITVEEDDEIDVVIALVPLPSSILGTVVDTSGGDTVAVSGATVTAIRIPSGEELTTESNISGEYQLIVPAGSWEISASAHGHQPSEEVVVRVRAGENLELDNANGFFILIPYRYRISGYVCNPDDEPINRATVILISEDGSEQRDFTPETGFYEFTIGAGTWTINATKPGFYLESGAVEIEVNEDLELHFRLIPQAGIVSGRVLVNGVPANRNAQVWFVPDAGEVDIRNPNQQGIFSQGLSPGDYTVIPVLQGHSTDDSLTINVGPGETISGLRLDLEPNPSSFAGRVLDNSEEPVINVAVSAGGVTGRTDVNGNYVLYVAAGNHLVTARKFGFVTVERGPISIDPGQNIVGINFEIVNNAGTISGRVRRGNDAIFDAAVTAVNLGNNARSTARTDRSGNYSFGLTFGTYRLTVQRDGFRPAEPDTIVVQLQPGQEVSGRNFAMRRNSGRVTGSVSSPAGAVNSPQVQVYPAGNPDRTLTTTGNVEGRFTMTLAPDNRYVVIATRNGFSVDTVVSALLEIEREVAVELNLRPLPCQVSGAVSSGEEPLTNAIVRAQGEEESFQTLTGRNGVYRLNLQTGDYHLTISRPGYITAEDDIPLNPGQRRQGVDFDLEENFASVTGFIIDADGEPIVNAIVALSDSINNRASTQTSNDDGFFSFIRVIPGTYGLHVEHPRYADGAMALGAILGRQERRGIRISLEPLDAMIHGQVLSDDNPVEGVTVYATEDGGGQSTALTNNQGRYAIRNLAVGNYRLRPARVGFTARDEDIEEREISPADTLEVNLTLIRNDGEIRGFVRDVGGAGRRGARITTFDSLGNFASTASSPTGEFLLENLFPLSRYSVTVQLERFTPGRDTVLNKAVGDTVNFTMRPNELEVSGRVENQADTPIPGTQVEATSLQDGSEFEAISDNQGNYVLEGLAPITRYRIQTNRFENIYTNTDIEIETEIGHLRNINLEIIQLSSTIGGSVGEVDVSIEARKRHREGEQDRIVNAYSNEDGNYRFLRLRDGVWVLRARKTGYRIRPDSIVVNLGVDEAVTGRNFEAEQILLSISGTVQDTNGRAKAGGGVLAWLSQEQRFRAVTGQNGQFTIDSLFPNQTYQVTTELPNEGYDNSSQTIALGLDDVADVSLVINRHNATIRGSVIDISGQPKRNITVRLDDLRETYTDGDGKFVLKYIGGGEHALSISKVGYWSKDTTISTGIGELEDSVNVNFSIEQIEGAIFGIISGASEEAPLYGVVVSAIDSDDNIVRQDTTGINGVYSLDGLQTNEQYILTVVKRGYVSGWRQNVSPDANQKNFTLRRQANSLLGFFNRSNGQKIPRAPVILRSFANTVAYDTTDHAGDFLFTVEAGTYMLLATHPDSAEVTSFNHNVSVNQSQTVFRVLTARNVGRINGQLVADGNPPGSSGYVVSRHTSTGDMVFNWSRPNGSFQLKGLRAGNHILTVDAAGYAMISGPVTIEVMAGAVVQVTIELTQEGKAINGFVADQNGDPVVGGRVTIDKDNEIYAELVTTDEGYYSLSNPEPGQYIISARKAGYETAISDTTDLEAGDIVTVNLEMERIPNAVSGRLTDDEGLLQENKTVYLRQSNTDIDSSSTNVYGEYELVNIDPGEYEIRPRGDGFRSRPTRTLVEIEPETSILNLDFLILPDRGEGTVSGVVIHGGIPDSTLEGVSVSIRNPSLGVNVMSTVTDSNGNFSFEDNVPAPATYKVRASIEHQGRVDSDEFSLDIDSTFETSLSFPDGLIRVILTDVKTGRGILGREVRVVGIDVPYDTVMFTDFDGSTETNNWLVPGSYRVAPKEASGGLPPNPVTIQLSLNETRELSWILGWRLDPRPPFHAQERGEVKISVPASVVVDEAKLFIRGVGKLEYESVDMVPEAGGSPERIRAARSINPVNRPTGADQTVTYVGYIPIQNRSGTLSFYVQFVTADGFIYGGPETAQDVTVTAEGLLNDIILTRSQGGSNPQVGVPVKLTIKAIDDVGHNLIDSLGLDRFELDWQLVDEQRGELSVDPDDPATGEYFPNELGIVKLQMTVTQHPENPEGNDIQLRKIIKWENQSLVLGFLSIDAPSFSVESGGSVMFTATARDTAQKLMSIFPIWKSDPDVIIDSFERTPYKLEAELTTRPKHIGKIHITVQDSISEMEAMFNEDNPDVSKRGFTIYHVLQIGVQDTVFDGEGFQVVIPDDAVDNDGNQLTLTKRILPAVYRLTPRFKTSEIAYKLKLNGRAKAGKEYKLTIPIPPNFVLNEPQVGIWVPDSVTWKEAGGELNSDGTAMEVIVDRLAGQFTLLSQKEPLGFHDVRFVPNPFSPHSATGKMLINFRLSSMDPQPTLSVKVYNMAGQLVKTIINRKSFDTGNVPFGSLFWDGLTDSGRIARNGRYLVVIIAEDSSGEEKEIGSVVLVK